MLQLMSTMADRFKRVGPNAMKGRGIGTARGRATIMRGTFQILNCPINFSPLLASPSLKPAPFTSHTPVLDYFLAISGLLPQPVMCCD